MSRNSLLETGAKFKIEVTATGLELGFCFILLMTNWTCNKIEKNIMTGIVLDFQSVSYLCLILT